MCIRDSSPAISRACFSFSSWQGPAIKVKGPVFEILSLPHLTDLFAIQSLTPAALIKDENNGCGVKGLDLNSG